MSNETNNAAPVVAPDASQSSESSQNVDASQVGEEEVPLTVAEKKKLKQLEIKYNGKTEKVDLPFEIDEEHSEYMRKQIQMSKMAQIKAQEAAGWEREVGAFLQQLQENPRKALSDPRYGVDLKKVAAEILQEEYERSQKSPQELADEEAKEERRKFLAEKEEWEENKKKAERQAIIDKASAHYDTEMANCLDRFDIPKTPESMSYIAHQMSLEIARGYEPDLELIGQMAENHFSNGYKNFIKNLSPEKRLKYLGEEIFEEDRKARVAKIKKAPPTAKNATQDVAKSEPKKESKERQTFRQRFGV